MRELSAESDLWKEEGCSLVWDKTLHAQLLQQQAPFALRDVLMWPQKGLPSSVIHNVASRAVLVEGLQTCLAVLGTRNDSNMFLRQVISPLIRRWQGTWPGRALIFGLHCDFQQWDVQIATNFATLKLQDDFIIDVTQSLWGGAANDVNKLMVPTNEQIGKATKTTSGIPGGFYVRRYS